MARTVNVFGTPVDFPDDATQEQVEGYLNSNDFLNDLSKANPKAYSDLQQEQQAQFVKAEGAGTRDPGTGKDLATVSFGGMKRVSPSRQPTVAEQQQVMGITSQSDKEARAQTDYLVENAPSVVKPVPALAAAQVAKGVGGKVRQVGDVVGSEGMSRWGHELAQEGTAVEEQVQREEPLQSGTWANSIRNALSSIYLQAPGMVAGGPLVAGGRKVAGMATALLPTGAVTGGAAYEKYRERGHGVGVSSLGSAAEEIIEVGTELLPTMTFFKAVTPGAKIGLKQFVTKLIEYGGEEYVGETLATLGQDVTDRYLTNPALSPRERQQKIEEYFTKTNPATGNTEAWDNFLETMRATTVQTVLMGSGGAAARRVIGGQPVDAAPVNHEAFDDVSAMPAPTGPLSKAVNKADPSTLPVPVDTIRVNPQGQGMRPAQYNPLRTAPGMTAEEIALSQRKIDERVPAAHPAKAATGTTDELVLDEARTWAQEQIKAGNTGLMRVTQEPQAAYDKRVMDAFRKAGIGDRGPVTEKKPEPVKTIPLVNPSGTIEQVATGEVMDRLLSGWSAPLAADSATPDYSGIHGQLTSQTFVTKTATSNGRPITVSDFSDALKMEYPTVHALGEKKITVLAALKNAAEGRPVSEKQQRILEAFQRDVTRYGDRGPEAGIREPGFGKGSEFQVPSPEVIRQKAERYAKLSGMDITGWPEEDLRDLVNSWERYAMSKGVPPEDPSLSRVPNLNQQAHEAATSPKNELPEPTPAQIEAGNYKKGHLKLHGLDISIENPQGSIRRGVDETGREWQTELAHHYGYIRGTVGKDKDHLDVFLGPDPDSDRVYIVDQLSTKTGGFDEHKVLMGFSSLDDARQGYLDSYDETGPERIGDISETSVAGFRHWLDQGSQKKPFGTIVGDQKPETENRKNTAKETADEETLGATGKGAAEPEAMPAVQGVDGQPGGRVPLLRESAEDRGREPVTAKDKTSPEKPASKFDAQTEIERQSIAEDAPKGTDTNKIFTKERADRAREILRKKLSQLNAGLDPEMVQAGIDLAGYHIEKGARSFAAYSKAMVEDLGEAVRPFLKAFYLAVRNYPGFDNAGMETEARLDELEAVALVEKANALPKIKSAQGGRKLRGDYGVQYIDAYTAAGEQAKTAFLKDAKAFLNDVAKVLAAEGWTSEKVSVNEGGVAVSGDVSLIAFREGHEHGVYVTIGGGVSLPGSNESRSGVRIMYRANTRKNKYTGLVNRWDAPWDVASGDLVAMMIAEAAIYEPKKEETRSVHTESRTIDQPDLFADAGNMVAKSEPVAQAEVEEPLETEPTEIAAGLRVEFNQEHNGIELHFASKPDAEVIARVKSMGFRWSMRQKVWYAKDSALRRQFAERLKNELSPSEVADSIQEKPGEPTAITVAPVSDNGIMVNEDTVTPAEADHGLQGNVDQPASVGKPEGTSAPEREGDSRRSDAGSAGERRGTGNAIDPSDDGRSSRKRNGSGKSSGNEQGSIRSARDNGQRDGGVLAVGGLNYRITDSDTLGKGGAKQKARDNIAAIRVIKQLTAEERHATPEEQAVLVKYVGWGASELANSIFEQTGYHPTTYRHGTWYKEGWEDLGKELKDLLSDEEYQAAKKSTLNAHYTPKGVIDGMYAALDRFGFTGGRILEPGSGIGHFIGLLPEKWLNNSRFTGVELDPTSAAIAKHLYPGHDVRHQAFEKFTMPDGFYDLAIGNIPFADIDILADPAYARHKFKLHDYFFAKAIDKVRPGGLLMFVTSKGTMDKASDKARAYLSERADLLGAVRLPQTAFKENAGTETVTDILFLKKREKGAEPGGKAWAVLKEIKTADGPVHVNEYFADQPEMVLGTNAITSSQHGPKYTVLPDGEDVVDRLYRIVNEYLPSKVYSPAKAESPADKPTVEFDLAPSNIKEGAYYLDDKGNLLSKENGIGKPVEKNGKDRDVIKAFIPLRDAVRNVLYVQVKSGDLAAAQKELKKQYDSFVKRFGIINLERRIVTSRNGKETVSIRTPNFSPFRDDPDAYLVASIELYNSERNTAALGPIFTERTIKPEVIPQINSISDALHVVMHESGLVDIAAIAEHMNVTEAQAIDALGTAIFHNPQTSRWETDDEYLSGNVKQKLVFAESAAQADPKYRRNVDALKAVQPVDLPPSRISINLGSPIVKPAEVERFAREVIDMGVKVAHVKQTGAWGVEKISGYQTANATSDWGTKRRDAAQLIDDALNSRQIRIESPVPDGNGGTKLAFDKDATNAANEKLVKIKERFRQWIWEDAARSEQLARAYNDTYNNTVKRVYGGDHIDKMTFPGMSAVVNPFDHQKRVAWRVVQSGNTYMAHSVGAGKTIGSILAGMELKRLGIKKKPCWVVPNHMLKQFSSEFLQLYPAAKILVADEVQFEKANRNRFMGRVAAENWDGIIITHSAFGKMQVSPEFSAQYIQEQIDELDWELSQVDKGDRLKRKQIERAKARLEQRLEKVLSTVGKDQGVTFEESGIDQLFIDEAHEFRKLDFVTNQTSIKGIDPNGSLMAFDLFVKTRYLEKLYPGRSLVLMSGTPITNTIGEIFSIQRFLQGPLLEERGLDNFDAWSATFGDMVTKLEATPAGNYKPVTRFAKFTNLSTLAQMWGEVGDFVHAKDLTYIKRPRVKGGGRQLVQAEQSSMQKMYKRALASRIKAIENRKRPPAKGDDILLTVITDGQHAALDERYIDPAAAIDPKENKLEKMCANVFSIWDETRAQRSTQMIFSDLGVPSSEERRGFSAYKRIRDSLIEKGIPANEIAFIQDYKKSDEKQKLFKAMNEGKIRVLIGSSIAMGTGVNAQKKLVALHHLDPDTYLPSNIEQREGRIVRQGNENQEVRLFAYVTKGSYDETMWQFLETKQRFIDQFLSGESLVDDATDVDGSADSFAMARAMSSDNPLVLERAGVEADIQRLESLRRAYFDDQQALRLNAVRAERNLPEYRKEIASLEAVIAKRIDTAGDAFAMKIGNKTFDKRKDAGEALWAKVIHLLKEAKEQDWHTVGTVAGLEIEARAGVALKMPFVNVMVGAGATYSSTLGWTGLDIDSDIDAVGLSMKLENLARKFDNELAIIRNNVARDEKLLSDSKDRIGRPFEHAQTLEEKRARLEEIERILKVEETSGAVADDNEDGVKFSLAEAERAPLSQEEFDAVFDRVTAGFEDAERSKLFAPVDTFADLPAAIQRQAEKQGAGEKDVKGVFHKGKVYLVRANIASTEILEEALFHEWHGHYGFNRLFEGKVKQGMLDIYNQVGAGKLFSIGRKYGINLMKYGQGLAQAGYDLDTRRAIMTEEMLAHLTSEYSSGSIAAKVREVIGQVRAWLRDHGFLKLAEWGETDIAWLLKRARLYAQSGAGQAEQAEPVVFSYEDLVNRLQSMGINEQQLQEALTYQPKFALAEVVEKISPSETLQKLKQFLNPLDYSRFREFAEDHLSTNAQSAIAWLAQSPYWKQQQDKAARPFYREGRRREEERFTDNVRMMGGLIDQEKITKDRETIRQRIRDFFSWSNIRTTWEETKRQSFYTMTKAQRDAYDVIRFEGDANGSEYKTIADARRNPRIKAALKQFGNEQAIQVFNFYREALAAEDVAFEEKLVIARENMEEAGIAPEEIEGHIAEYRATYKDVKGWVHRDHGEGDQVVTVHHVIDRLDWLTDEVERSGSDQGPEKAFRVRLGYYPGHALAQQMEQVVGELGGTFKQLQNGQIIMLFRLEEKEQALEQLNAIPLTREDGGHYRVMVYSRFVSTKGKARSLEQQVKQNLKAAMPVAYRDGHTYEVGRKMSTSIREEEFQDLKMSDLALERVMTEALKRAKNRGELEPEDAEALREAVLQNVAESLLGRGAGLYQIRRASYLIEGYDRTNAVEKFESYVHGVAGMFSKARHALRQFNNLKNAPIEIRPWATQYVADSLRNMGRADRLSGDARAFASLWYLGFNLTWMLINHTQPYAVGVAVLSRQIGEGAFLKTGGQPGALRRIVGAEKDIVTSRLTLEEKALFDDPRVQIQFKETQLAEMTGSDAGVGGKVSQAVHGAVHVTLAHGQKVEQLNRKTIILAAYRTFRDQGYSADASLAQALEVNSAVNIDMGRYNLPGYARKPLGRSLYTLQSYIQHMLQMLYHYGTSGETRDQKALLRLLFAMQLIGGLPAGAPGSDELDKLIRKIFGYSPKLALRGFTKRFASDYGTIGELLDAFVWRGVPGMLGVSFTGSVQFRIPIISNLIAGDDLAKSFSGALGGLGQKAFMAGRQLLRGDVGRAAEYASPTAAANILSAVRQSEGVETTHGKPVYYKGRQLQMTLPEAVIRSTGMQPARIADIQETRRIQSELESEWSGRRADTLDQVRFKGGMRGVREFNRDLRRSQARGLISPITSESIERGRGKVDRKAAAWERRYGLD